MSQGYQLTASAQRLGDEIGAIIAEDSIDAAFRVHDALEQTFEHLATHPGIRHAREDLTDRPLKFFSVYSYLVVYDPVSRPVTIVGVLHGARDVELLLNKIEP